MFCKYCGKQLPDNSNFCSGCGKGLGLPVVTNNPQINEEQPQKEKVFRERHGFTTFWLWIILITNILILLFSHSINNNASNDLMKLFGLANEFTRALDIISTLVRIVSVILLLNWKIIGFWLIIIFDCIYAFLVPGTLLWLLLLGISALILFAILNLRKNGISTWDYLRKEAGR